MAHRVGHGAAAGELVLEQETELAQVVQVTGEPSQQSGGAHTGWQRHWLRPFLSTPPGSHRHLAFGPKPAFGAHHPEQAHLAHALAPIAAVLGHNYSIYLPEFNENGRFIRLRGGAGGAPALGGAIGLWWPSVLIILPLGALIFFTLGYASVTTLSVAIFAILSFSIRMAAGAPGANWFDIAYGVICLVLLAWALRPNLTKLINGTERVVGISLHGRIKAKKDQREAKDALDDVA